MDIRHPNQIKAQAAQRLAACPEEKKLILMVTGISLGLSLLVTVINYILGLEIDKTGGLGSMGTRAVLDTLRQVLPMIQSLVIVCLELGYLAAMLRIARGQFVSPRTLKLGFDRFWPLLRLTLLRGLMFLGVGVASMYLSIMIFVLTPLSDPAAQLLAPLVSGGTVDPSLLLDDTLYSQLIGTMIPCFILLVVLYVLLALPVWYRYRLASFLLIDRPAWGAARVMGESRKRMKGNRFAFFRLDLSLWYYHVPLFLTGFLAYGDVLLSLAGVTLPVSEEVSFFGFYILSLACQLALAWGLRNRAETAYCLAYESLLPREPEASEIVLGNIFQM